MRRFQILAPLCAHLHAQRLVEPLGTLAVHDQAFRFKHCVQHQVAVTRILFSERLESITQQLIITRLRLISG